VDLTRTLALLATLAVTSGCWSSTQPVTPAISRPGDLVVKAGLRKGTDQLEARGTFGEL